MLLIRDHMLIHQISLTPSNYCWNETNYSTNHLYYNLGREIWNGTSIVQLIV